MAVVFNGAGQPVDFEDNVNVQAGQVAIVDFDMSRQSYVDANLSRADKKALEDFREKNLPAIDANEETRKAHDLLLPILHMEKKSQFSQAETLALAAVKQMPGEPRLWDALGDAQLGAANLMAAANTEQANSVHIGNRSYVFPTSASALPLQSDAGPEAEKAYKDALASYRKALDANIARATPIHGFAAPVWYKMGLIDALLRRTKEAVDAYHHAAAADPAGAALYSVSEAAVLYSAGDANGSADAAARAVSADPKSADAYYYLGMTLHPDQPTSASPAGANRCGSKCLDVFETYLTLAPSGAHAEEVRDILAADGYDPSHLAPRPVAGKAATNAASQSATTMPSTQSSPQPLSLTSPRIEIASTPQPAAQPLPKPASAPPELAADRGFAIVEQPKPPPKPSVPIPHNYALIFATDTYAHWPHLENPVSDADALNDTLTSLYGFQVDELKNPTEDQILRKLREYLSRRFDPQDQLMIVFSGHGYFDDDLGQGFIAPADALAVDDDLGHRTLLAHETIMNYVNRIPSKHVLLVIDACFAGTLDRRIADASLRGDATDVYVHATLPELLERKESKRTRRYFASGGKDFVPDGLPGHHSPFISAFLVALNQAADRKGYATLDDLQQGLNTVNPEPRWGDIEGDNDPGADFLLLTPAAIRQLSAAAPPPAAPAP
jgi:tetratricopeptide (TPR) repeat protein